MSTIPGMPASGLSTFMNTLPPVAPYLHQHRTNIIVNFPKSVWSVEANYGIEYFADNISQVLDFGAMSTVNLSAIQTSIKNSLNAVLLALQNKSASNLGLGFSYYAYELELLTGFYYITKIGLFDVTAISWVIESQGETPNAPSRFFLVRPFNDTTDSTSRGYSNVIQWGYEPPTTILIS